MLARLRYEPRRLAISLGVLAAVIVFAVVAAVVVHLTRGGSSPGAAPRPNPAAPPPATSPSAQPTPLASDTARWDALPAIMPASSSAYPAIPAADRNDPTSYARAFAIELFTRDYQTSTRAQLLAWAQYEDAALKSPKYPRQDWTKVLVDSLTDLSWDGAAQTPVPADGPWLALRSEQSRQTVSDVKVALDPLWEQRIGSGYQPPDPRATERDVTLTITRRTDVGARTSLTNYSVSLALQLGTSTRGAGYGVAATNNYVIKQVS